MMKRIFFFATPDDIALYWRGLKRTHQLKFVGLENLITPDREIYQSRRKYPIRDFHT